MNAPVPGLNPAALPADALEVGRLGEAWGIKGWLHVVPHSADASALFHAKRWYLARPEGRYARGFQGFEGTVQVAVLQIKDHAQSIVAQFEGVDSRNQSEALKGARILIARSDFPPATEGEYYWVDLIGLSVVNREGVVLGVVKDLMPTGPHSVLCLEQPTGQTLPDGSPELIERMIPFVDAYVDQVDLSARRITVDWQPDY